MLDLEAELKWQRKHVRLQWLGRAYDVLNEMEGRHLCDYMETERNLQCTSALNGQLQQGLSTVIGSLISAIIQKDLKFRAEGNSGLETDSEFAELQNVKTLFIDEGFDILEKTMSSSIMDYFRKQRTNRIIAFVCFLGAILMLAVLLWTWGLRHLKRNFATTNAIVGLIPANWMTDLEGQRIKND